MPTDHIYNEACVNAYDLNMYPDVYDINMPQEKQYEQRMISCIVIIDRYHFEPSKILLRYHVDAADLEYFRPVWAQVLADTKARIDANKLKYGRK